MRDLFAPTRPPRNDDGTKTKKYRQFGDAKKSEKEAEPKQDDPDQQS